MVDLDGSVDDLELLTMIRLEIVGSRMLVFVSINRVVARSLFFRIGFFSGSDLIPIFFQ